MKFIKKHKILIIVLIILLALIIAGFIFVKKLMVDTSKDLYGNRLNGIEKVEIGDAAVTKLTQEIEALEEVEALTYRLQGRLIYIEIKYTETTEIEVAKEIAVKVLDYFEEDEKSYYDMQITLTNKDGEKAGYPIMGYKHKTTESIVW